MQWTRYKKTLAWLARGRKVRYEIDYSHADGVWWLTQWPYDGTLGPTQSYAIRQKAQAAAEQLEA